MILLLAISLFTLCIHSIAHAYPDNYGPFAPHEEPELYPIYELEKETITAKTNTNYIAKYKAVDGNEITIINIYFQRSSYETFAEFTDKNGKKLLPLIKTGRDPICFGKVYYAYLNSDDKKDFIIEHWSCGVGLAAHICDVFFILSSKHGYQYKMVSTYDPDEHDFIKGPADNCLYIHTHITDAKSKDGKRHSFWVHNLLKFEGDNVVLANELYNQFPKFVWYTYKPNHKETTILTKGRKNSLLQEFINKIIREPKDVINNNK